MKQLLFHPTIIAILFFVNLLGTIYGYFWYGDQLEQTPLIFLAFVPDSPTASLFFTIFLCCYLYGKQFKLIEAFAYVSLLKYGIWAVVMNALTWYVDGSLPWTGICLCYHMALWRCRHICTVLYIDFTFHIS